MTWYRNHFHCPACDVSWSIEDPDWLGDECSGCGEFHFPNRLENLTFVTDGHRVLHADGCPGYRPIAVAVNPEWAEKIKEALS